MNDKLKVPDDKRHLFSQPLGELISGSREETIPMVKSKIQKLKIEGEKFFFYIVGDIVAQDFLANELLRTHIKLCIIDEKTQRKKINVTNTEFFEEILTLKNPKGTISEKSWDILEKIVFSDKRTLLKITDGEEDLLVLPLISLLPLNNERIDFVFYGQPPITDSKQNIPEGIIMVQVNRKVKITVNRFLKFMDKIK